MTPNPLPEPRSDERTFAMFGHLSQLICCVAPLILYLFQRSRSKFAAFHALQSFFFQLALFCFSNSTAILAHVLIAFKVMPNPFQNFEDQVSRDIGLQGGPDLFSGMLMGSCASLCIGLPALVLMVVLAIRANKGQYARYPLVGGLAHRVVFGA